MSEAAWNKAFTHGSKALQDRLKNVHAKNPKFQSWLKSSGHGAGQSVGQASKEVKTSERAKGLKTKSLAAYGATKGTRMGSAEGTGETQRDTIKPLTRDQHSKIAAAKREAKKAAAPKREPIKSKEDRLSFIKKTFAKAKSPDRQARFDVPTLEKDHEDLRHDHDLMHSVGVKQSYNEGFDPSPDEIAKHLIDKHGPNVTKGHIEDLEQDRDSHHALDHEEIMKSIKKLTQNEETKQEAEKLLGGPVRAKSELPPAKNPMRNRARNLARQAMKAGKPVTESTAEVEVNEMSSHGKALAKRIMAKNKSMHPIAQHMGEAADDSREYDYEGDMAKSQLKSIITNAQKLHDALEDDTNLPEWVQLKITLAEDYIVTAANYMEGELDEETLQRRASTPKDRMTRLAFRAQTKDEVRANHVRIYKKMQKDDPSKAEKFKEKYLKNEEIEVVDEVAPPGREKQVKALKKVPGITNPYAVAWASYNKSKKNEEVEQVTEKNENVDESAETYKKAFRRVANRNLEKDVGTPKAKVYRLDPHPKKADLTPADDDEENVKHDVRKMIAGHRVNEGDEGSVPTTPQEKALAAHHGDPNRITYGDVIKARLKAAAKKGK